MNYFYVTDTGMVCQYEVPSGANHFQWWAKIGRGFHPDAFAMGFESQEEAQAWYRSFIGEG